MPGDRLEVKYDNYIVDIVRGDLLLEVQTGSFHTCRKKFDTLCEKAKLTVYTDDGHAINAFPLCNCFCIKAL